MPNNEQGQRAEEIFGIRITQDYLFRARDLGAKWPVSDFYVEINDDNAPFYFIVQVKSSSRGYYKNKNLKISISKKKINQLSNYYAPTYLAGIDIEKEIVYLTPAYKINQTGISKISSNFILTAADKTLSLKNLKSLKNEIQTFWKQTNTKSKKRFFKTSI